MTWRHPRTHSSDGLSGPIVHISVYSYGATSTGDTDKRGKEWHAPLHPIARDALDAWLASEGCGDDRLFPGVDRHQAARWLREAEERAGLTPLDGGLWHPYRRLFATERIHLPAKAVAKAGGWSKVSTMEQSYQQAPDEVTRDVVLNERP